MSILLLWYICALITMVFILIDFTFNNNEDTITIRDVFVCGLFIVGGPLGTFSIIGAIIIVIFIHGIPWDRVIYRKIKK